MNARQVPDFWDFAHQVAFYTGDRHKAYERLKADWQRQNPGASHVEHEQAMTRLAKLCRV